MIGRSRSGAIPGNFPGIDPRLPFSLIKRIKLHFPNFYWSRSPLRRPAGGRRRRRMSRPPEDICSICHDNFTLPCQANCSHWFCAQCIMRVWNHGSPLQPCKCPICRRLITLLVPCDSGVIRHDSESAQALGLIENYNRIFGGAPRTVIQRLQDLPFFMRRMMRDLMDPQRSLPIVVRTRMLFGMLLSFLYVVSPVDILPEALLGVVGFLDDLLIVLIVFLHLTAIYRSALLDRHGGS